MSFDRMKTFETICDDLVSIPFEQGDVFRRLDEKVQKAKTLVSIPFEQGDVFRHQE